MNPGVYYYYRYIRPDREINWDISTSYQYSKEYNDTKSYLDSKITDEDDNQTTSKRPVLSANFRWNEYLKKNLGVALISDIYLYRSENLRNNNNQSWISTQYRDRYSDDKQESTTSRYNLGVSGFYGRIYNGRYAAKALEILNELEKAGKLKRSLTKAEFNCFSEIVMRNVASYHYDARIKKIEALTEISEYLQSIDVLNSENPFAFAIINDIYSNTPFSVDRNFGKRFYISLKMQPEEYKTFTKHDYYNINYRIHYDADKPVIDSLISDSYSGNSTDHKGSALIPIINVGWEYCKIINWHLWYKHSITVGFQKYHEKNKTTYKNYDNDGPSDIDVVKLPTDNREVSITINNTINYQVDSRSYLSLDITASYSNLFMDYDNENYLKYQITQEEYNFLISPSFRYYFSPKISLTCYGSLGYAKYFQLSEYENLSRITYKYKNGNNHLNKSLSVSFSFYL